MPRRLLITLLSALALLLAAAPSVLAAPAPQAGPTAAAAVDEVPAGEEECSDDPEVELPACTDGWEDGGDDAGLCDADLSEEHLHASAAQEEEEEWSDDDAWLDDECDAPAPTLSGLAAAVTGRGARTRVRVTFTLDLPGEVELTLARVEEGVTRRGRCAAAPARSAKQAKGAKGGKRGKRCSRVVELRGSVVVDGDAGANATDLRRRWGGRALAAGSYKLTATPLDGDASATASFALAGRSGR